MSIDSNDPRLTAYALGELEGEARAAFEGLLEGDPAAREEVAALRALGRELETALAGAGASVLDEARREVVTAGAVHGGRSLHFVRMAAAATVLVGLGALVLALTRPIVQERARDATKVVSLPMEANGEPALRGARETDGSALETWEQEFGAEVKEEAARPSGGRPAAVQGLAVPVAPRAGEAVAVVDEEQASKRAFLLRWYRDRVPAGLPLSMREPIEPSMPGLAPAADPALPGAVAPGGTVALRLPAPEPAAALPSARLPGGEQYTHPGIDPFHRVTTKDGHTSTFSVDVDTASYTNIRRMLREGQLPPPAAVRVEELVNYFDYGYAPPEAGSEAPLRMHVQIAACPWEPRHRLARIALKGREVDARQRPASNLVFLVDVSGSMEDEDKLPLVKAGLERLAESIRNDDRVAIVTYASTASLVLPSTPGSEREAILAAIHALRAGGSTNGAGGIQLAYAEAQKGFRQGGVNRVILCTDGDFNVGVSDTDGLVRLIAEKAESGVYLSVLGYGTGNLQDGKMEALSNRGNGNYAYVDSQQESERVLIEEMQGTLVTIAKDVKFQLWFNPKTVVGWRLLGYENRQLAARDFNDDKKDAGDIGSGHEVTALYEIIPTGAGVRRASPRDTRW